MFGVAYYFLWMAGATASCALWVGLANEAQSTRLAVCLIPIVITLFITALCKAGV